MQKHNHVLLASRRRVHKRPWDMRHRPRFCAVDCRHRGLHGRRRRDGMGVPQHRLGRPQISTRPLVLFAAGGLFGAGLALSGMTDPGRVVGFLDVTGAWDPSLAFVMGGALAVFGVGALAWRKLHGAKGLYGSTVPTRSTEPIEARFPCFIKDAIWSRGGINVPCI